MSFEYNQPETNSESEPQFESQNIDFSKMKPKEPPVPFDDVALGISYYYGAIKTMIIAYLVGFIVVFIFVASTIDKGNFDKALQYLSLSGLLNLIVIAIASPLIIKAMSSLCKTPSMIVPNAKSTIVKSWVIYGIAYFVSFFANILIVKNHSMVAIVDAISVALMAYSFYLFMNLLSAIGKFCLPSKKGCRAAIILLMIFYALTALATLSADGNIENLKSSTDLQSPDAATNPAMALGRLASIFYLIGGIMYLSYIEKLNKFFNAKNNVRKLQKEDAKKSAYSGWFIVLIVFSALGFIGYVGNIISHRSAVREAKARVKQVLEEYNNKAKTAMDDWNNTFDLCGNETITNEQFDNWIVNTHIPAWKEALNVLDNAKDLDGVFIIENFKDITKDRIEYCQGFHTAIQEQSTELFKKAYQDFQKVDLKVVLLSKTKENIPKDIAQQILLKSIIANNVLTAKWAISKGADINEPVDGVELINLAREYNSQDIIDFLKENGITEKIPPEIENTQIDTGEEDIIIEDNPSSEEQ